MAHHSLGCYDTQFFVSLQLALQNNCQHFLSSLNQLEILLVGKIKRSDFIVKYSNILVHVSFREFDVFCNIQLVAKCDASEKFDKHVFVQIVWPI